MKRLLAGLALALFGLASATWADRVDDLVQRERKQQKIPGVSIAVVRNGKIIKVAGYGLANVEHQVPAKPETIYQSGSVGKMFTAALVMLLARDGKLSLNDSIRKHLPETPESWSGITVRHLLNHTAGLGDPYPKLDLRKDYTDAELLKIEGELPLLSRPGEKWLYSDMGYHVLGFLCNRVGSKFYVDQLRERIFTPAKMTTARGISESEIVPNRAAGYERDKGTLKNQGWVAPVLNTTADGSLYFSVLDLARWDAALYTETPLSASIKTLSWTQTKLPSGEKIGYGFGWQIDTVNGHRRVHHNGYWQGFSTQISRYVDDRLTVIVLTNLAGADPTRIANQVADLYLPSLRNTKGRTASARIL
jgi:D-alanyl-D-alanine carboxypeptidase